MLYGQVAIGTATPHQSSILELSDTSKGILVPRMTYKQREKIVLPAEGLLIFQIDTLKGFWFYSENKWQQISNNIANKNMYSGPETVVIFEKSISEINQILLNQISPNLKH